MVIKTSRFILIGKLVQILSLDNSILAKRIIKVIGDQKIRNSLFYEVLNYINFYD